MRRNVAAECCSASPPPRKENDASMMVETAVFTCSICGEPSRDICVLCTKDACANHRCERCKRCSDCCECEVPLSAAEPVEAHQVEETHPPLGDGHGSAPAAVQTPEPVIQPAPTEPAASQSSSLPDEIGQ